MERILIISSSQKIRDFLIELLCAYAQYEISAVTCGSEARRLYRETEFDLVLINAPLSDEFGHELAIDCTDESAAGVMILVKAELADEVSAKVEDDGVFVVPKPVGRQMFFQSLRLLTATRRRLLGLKDENIRLQQKVEEIRLVDRAKCALIQYLNMTEAQAHRHIEKQAMDLRVSRAKIAQSILNTYES